MRRYKILFVICLSFMISYLISSEIKKSNEKDAQFYYEQCKIDFTANKIDEAIKNGEMAVELDGTKPDYYFHLAIACDEKLKHASGLNALYYAKKLKKNIEKAVILDSKNIEYRTILLNFFLNAPRIAGGSKQNAKRQSEEILKINPIIGHLKYADIYTKLEDSDNAESHLIKAYKLSLANKNISPSEKSDFHAQILNNYAYRLLSLKKIEKAIDFFRMNVVAFPNYFNVYDSLGEAYKIEGDKKLAIENYKRALELNPRKTQFEIKAYEDGKKILEELLKN